MSFLAGIIICILMSIVVVSLKIKSSIYTSLVILCGGVLIAGFVGLAYHMLNKKFFLKKQARFLNVLVAKYSEVVGIISNEMSDDTRLVMSVLMYRRDLKQLIELISEDMGKKVCLLESHIFSFLCVSQVNNAINAVLKEKSPKLLDLIQSCSVLDGIIGDTATYLVDNEEDHKRMRGAFDAFDEALSVLGLKASLRYCN